jgi:quinoprotein glucose dehydrogenase
MVTSTLLFAGESDGPSFRALDKATGRTIAEIELPGPTSGNPMTFMHEGRQYIVVAITEGGQPSELVALRLPGGN